MKIGNTTVLSAEGTSKLSASIKRRGRTLDRDVQVAGLSACFHAMKSGNANLVTEVAGSLSAGKNRTAFREWITQNTPIKVSNKGKATVKSGWKAEDYDLETLEGVEWHTYKAAPKARELDLPALEKALRKFAENEAENVTVSRDAETVAKAILDSYFPQEVAEAA